MSNTAQFDNVQLTDAGGHRALDVSLALLSAGIALLAIAMCILRPEQLAAWMLTMLFVPIAAGGVRKLTTRMPNRARRALLFTVFAAGLLIVVPLGLRVAETLGLLEYVAVRRGIGVLLGGALLIVGGYLPRHLDTLARARWGELTGKGLVTMARWGLVVAGFGYAALWALAPLAQANLWASAFAGTALALTAVRCVLLCRLQGSARQPGGRPAKPE